MNFDLLIVKRMLCSRVMSLCVLLVLSVIPIFKTQSDKLTVMKCLVVAVSVCGVVLIGIFSPITRIKCLFESMAKVVQKLKFTAVITC